MIAVINIGISNLNSVINALEKLGLKYKVSDREEDIAKASHILLPGVGTFEMGMSELYKKGLVKFIKDEVLKKEKPFLGICLGMQLLFDRSDESPGVKGLGILKGSVINLPRTGEYTIPRIGWAETLCNKDFLSFKEGQKIDFYYLHSYYVSPDDKSLVAMTTENNNITATVSSKRIIGCQFHPEKSHTSGLKILEEFVKL